MREDSLRVSPGIRDAVSSNIDFNNDGVGDAYYKPGFGDLLFGIEDRESAALTGCSNGSSTLTSNSLVTFPIPISLD